MKRFPTELPVLIGSLALLLANVACSSEKTVESTPPETVSDVSTLILQRSALPSYYEAVGTVRPRQSAQMATQVMGNLVRVNVREGDRVSRGQVLAVVDDSQTRAAVDRASAGQTAAQQDIAAAEADYSLAQSTLKRYQSLYERKSVSPHEFDQVQARFAAATARLELARAGHAGSEAALTQARTSQGFTQVRAPFSGVVTAKLAEAGDLASPGTPVFVVEDTSSFRLEATVDERGIAAVRLGELVPVVLDALESHPLAGKVVQILPASDPASRTFLVKIELPRNSAIRSGLFGRARFPLGTREALSIPQTAVVERGNMQAVYVLGTGEIASLRYITLGRSDQQSVEVLSGLDDGERIVARPGSRELNGKKIEVR
jgi:RND family efflux transporter MFP subunit